MVVPRSRKKRKNGVVAVEMAIVAPLLFTLLFGIIEFGWLFTVKNTMVNAAREGARVGALQGTGFADMNARVIQYLQPTGLDTKVSINIVEATPASPIVSVTLSVPQADVSLVGNFFGVVTGNINATASMRKEGL